MQEDVHRLFVNATPPYMRTWVSFDFGIHRGVGGVLEPTPHPWILRETIYYFRSHFKTSVGNQLSYISKGFLLEFPPPSGFHFICTNIKGMCWLFYFKNRNWKHLLRIFDMTELKNSQRNCPLGSKFGLGKGLLSSLLPLCALSTLQRDQCVAVQWEGWATSLVPSLNKGDIQWLFCFLLCQRTRLKNMLFMINSGEKNSTQRKFFPRFKTKQTMFNPYAKTFQDNYYCAVWRVLFVLILFQAYWSWQISRPTKDKGRGKAACEPKVSGQAGLE
jgi:hypothetical protein